MLARSSRAVPMAAPLRTRRNPRAVLLAAPRATIRGRAGYTGRARRSGLSRRPRSPGRTRTSRPERSGAIRSACDPTRMRPKISPWATVRPAAGTTSMPATPAGLDHVRDPLAPEVTGEARHRPVVVEDVRAVAVQWTPPHQAPEVRGRHVSVPRTQRPAQVGTLLTTYAEYLQRRAPKVRSSAQILFQEVAPAGLPGQLRDGEALRPAAAHGAAPHLGDSDALRDPAGGPEPDRLGHGALPPAAARRACLRADAGLQPTRLLPDLPNETLPQFLDAHERAFEHFGGHTREHL